jgi:hypothetical protein
MDAAQLYQELLECGECLTRAIGDERRASFACSKNSRAADARLLAARREVERSAEYYALALRSFRTTTLSELCRSTSAVPSKSGRVDRAVPGAKPAKASKRGARSGFAAQGSAKFH